MKVDGVTISSRAITSDGLNEGRQTRNAVFDAEGFPRRLDWQRRTLNERPKAADFVPRTLETKGEAFALTYRFEVSGAGLPEIDFINSRKRR